MDHNFLDITRRAKFSALMTKYKALHAAGEGETDDALEILADAVEIAPPEMKEALDRIFIEVYGEWPEAEFCDDDGNPCYSLEQLEKWIGHEIKPEDLEKVRRRHVLVKPRYRVH